MWWWLLPKNCTPFYNKYTRWRAVAVPSCPVAALLLLPARCPFQGHTDRWGKVSLPNQARRRWHKFSVASNRKTNLILETRTLLSLSLGDWIEGKEGDSNLVVPQIVLVFFTWSHRDPDADPRVVPRDDDIDSLGKREVCGGGDTRSTLSSFFVFPDAPHDNDHDWCGGDPSSFRFFFRFEHSPSLLQRVALRISVFYSNFSTLDEQFLTPSLESISIHIVPFCLRATPFFFFF